MSKKGTWKEAKAKQDQRGREKSAAADKRKKKAKRFGPVKTVARKSPVRRGGFFLDNFLSVFRAMQANGMNEFSTQHIVEETGLAYSSVYKWMKGLEFHGIVEGWLDVTRTGRGDYRWRMLYKLAPVGRRTEVQTAKRVRRSAASVKKALEADKS